MTLDNVSLCVVGKLSFFVVNLSGRTGNVKSGWKKQAKRAENGIETVETRH